MVKSNGRLWNQNNESRNFFYWLGVFAMNPDTEIKISSYEILNHNLEIIETERSIALIQRERFDYTKWRENLFGEMTGKEISKMAMEFQNTLKIF